MLWKKRRPSAGSVFLALVVVFSIVFSVPLVSAQEPVLQAQIEAEALLKQMTPEERIGQLFLLTFQGSTVIPDSPIYNLIHDRHIGGVVLLAKRDNFAPTGNDQSTIPANAQALIRELQLTEWNSAQNDQVNPADGRSYRPSYVPLFIGTIQEGDGYPYDQIRGGITTLPSQMAIGAAWTPALAEQAGNVLGKELSSIGINMLIGPSLDVLDLPQNEIASNLGIRTFGGDPYWVGEMGRSFIRGAHLGSNGRMALVAKHFPGHGGSDRLPEEEVATVRKSLDELKSIDLAPFLTVTGNALSPEETTDAVLSSHIRYQGLQGNIRTTTRPVSLDPQALNLLMELPGLVNWRKSGGLVISDDLGSMAVRRFYELTNQSFDPRRVALNAFLAGNDILFSADFSTNNNPDSYEETLRTLDFFVQKYREDSAFSQRVDESVTRILMLKNRLYPGFDLESVEPGLADLDQVGKNSAVTFEIARNAATLLSPSQSELDITIPDPPNQNDRIVFIVDSRTSQQCSNCAQMPVLSTQSMQDAVMRLYGPQAGGQILSSNLSSYSFSDLLNMLDSKDANSPLEDSLVRAHWIIMLPISDTGPAPAFQTLKRFLAERPSLFQQKRLIVFALSAPYYLDATNISKLTAYFVLYSKASPFIDTAAYLLFGELRAIGSPPISVPGTGYNLNEALFPNPDIPILLEIDQPSATQVITGTVTPVPAAMPEYRVGDVIPLRAGVVLDHNGHPVPDGTPVTFVFSFNGEPTTVRQTAYTQKGIARTTFTVTGSGALEVSAESENARSEPIKLDIPLPDGAASTPTPSPEPTASPTDIPPSPTPEPVVTQPGSPPPARQLNLEEWLIAVVLSIGTALGLYRLVALLINPRWGFRSAMLAMIGGLMGYSYLAIRLPFNDPASDEPLALMALLTSLIGIALGLLIALAWRFLVNLTRQVRSRQS